MQICLVLNSSALSLSSLIDLLDFHTPDKATYWQNFNSLNTYGIYSISHVFSHTSLPCLSSPPCCCSYIHISSQVQDLSDRFPWDRVNYSFPWATVNASQTIWTRFTSWSVKSGELACLSILTCNTMPAMIFVFKTLIGVVKNNGKKLYPVIR